MKRVWKVFTSLFFFISSSIGEFDLGARREVKKVCVSHVEVFLFSEISSRVVLSCGLRNRDNGRARWDFDEWPPRLFALIYREACRQLWRLLFHLEYEVGECRFPWIRVLRRNLSLDEMIEAEERIQWCRKWWFPRCGRSKLRAKVWGTGERRMGLFKMEKLLVIAEKQGRMLVDSGWWVWSRRGDRLSIDRSIGAFGRIVWEIWEKKKNIWNDRRLRFRFESRFWKLEWKLDVIFLENYRNNLYLYFLKKKEYIYIYKVVYFCKETSKGIMS